MNNESASRRRELKEAKDKLAGLESTGKSDLEKLQASFDALQKEHTAASVELRNYKLKEAFKAAALKSQITWASEQALEDAFILAMPAMMQAEEDGADYEKILKSVLSGRPYLTTTTKKAPDLDGSKRSDETMPPTAEELRAAKRKQLGNPRL